MSWKDNFPEENRYFETENGILYCGDAIKTMSKFPNESVDLILTDPPYGTTACKWDTIIPFEDMWKYLKKIRKDRTPIVLFGSEPFSSYLRISNIKEYKYDWMWIKNNGTNAFLAKIQPMKRHEIISVFGKGKVNYYPQMRVGKPYKWRSKRTKGEAVGYYNLKKHTEINNSGTRYPITILEFKQERGLHPTQKPVSLLKYLIKTYTNESDLVLDFTCGSGSTLVACEKLRRKWVGIEINKEYCEITKQRILNLKGGKQ